MNAAIQTQREQIFKAMDIIEACRMGSQSVITSVKGKDDPDFSGALAAAYELLDAVATQLEIIGSARDKSGEPDARNKNADTEQTDTQDET